MKNYHKANRVYFLVAILTVLVSTIFAVVLQFFKGHVLDNALSANTQKTIFYTILLIAFILGEVVFYFLSLV